MILSELSKSEVYIWFYSFRDVWLTRVTMNILTVIMYATCLLEADKTGDRYLDGVG